MTAPTLRREHVADLARSGLTVEDAAAAGIRSLTSDEASTLLRTAVRTGGLAFPYSGTDLIRVRMDTPHKFPDGREAKYLAPRGSTNHLYVPDGVLAELRTDPGATLYVVEGEKKALCLRQRLGVTAVGIPGCWSWKAKRESGVVEELDALAPLLRRRRVVVVLDSDARTNVDIARSAHALAEWVRTEGKGSPFWAFPAPDGASKVGVDDLFVAGGVDAVRALLEGAVHPQEPAAYVLRERLKRAPTRHPGSEFVGTELFDELRELLARAPDALRTPLAKEVQVALGLDASERAALLSEARRRSKAASPADQSTARQLIELARRDYEFARTPEGEAIAIPRSGPRLARRLRGSRSALRSELSATFFDETNRVPPQAALTDALTAIDGFCARGQTHEVAQRVARDGENVVIDLVDAQGRAVVVRPGSWEVVDRSPVLFLRVEPTLALPMPQRGGRIDDLFSLVNVSPGDRSLFVAWLAAAFIADMPHPILLLQGEQGTAKSFTGRAVMRLVDPTPGSLQTPPRDTEQWCVAAAGSWVIGLDNVSSIPLWLQDALCRAVTGDALVRRKLWTDSDRSVVSFRRVVVLTSIDPGALRGDLCERLVLVELSRIPERERRTERELNERFARLHPALFGALLDLVAEVLSVLPGIAPERLPRMADFARVVAAVDRVRGTDALATYAAGLERSARDVLDDDPIAAAVLDLVDSRGSWTGTASQLVGELRPTPTPKKWPWTGRRMAGALRVIASALREVGVEYSPPEPQGKSRARLLTLRRVSAASPASGAETRREEDGPEPCEDAAPDCAGDGSRADDVADDLDAADDLDPSIVRSQSPDFEAGAPRADEADDCQLLLSSVGLSTSKSNQERNSRATAVGGREEETRRQPSASSAWPRSVLVDGDATDMAELLEERAAIRQFDGGQSRVDAERAAAEELLGVGVMS